MKIIAKLARERLTVGHRIILKDFGKGTVAITPNEHSSMYKVFLDTPIETEDGTVKFVFLEVEGMKNQLKKIIGFDKRKDNITFVFTEKGFELRDAYGNPFAWYEG